MSVRPFSNCTIFCHVALSLCCHHTPLWAGAEFLWRKLVPAIKLKLRFKLLYGTKFLMALLLHMTFFLNGTRLTLATSDVYYPYCTCHYASHIHISYYVNFWPCQWDMHVGCAWVWVWNKPHRLNSECFAIYSHVTPSGWYLTHGDSCLCCTYCICGAVCVL